MQRASLLVLVLAITWSTSAQEKPLPKARFTHTQLDQVNALVKSRRYKEAISLSLSTAEQMRALPDKEAYAVFMLRAAEIETFEVWKGKGFHDTEIFPDYRRPQRYLATLQANAGKALDDHPYLKANVFFTQGVVYHWLSMPDTAEYLQNKALDMRRKIYGETSREVGDSYLWRGVLYRWGLQRRDLAEQNYQKALELLRNFMPDSRYALGSTYFGLADIARENFQFDKALTLADQYLSCYHDIPYEQTFGIQLKANVYRTQGDYEKAIESRKQAIRIYKESKFEGDLIMEYSNLLSDLANLSRFDEAEKVLKEGERILNASSVKDVYYTRMLYENAGDLYRYKKQYKTAEAYLNKALAMAIRQYGEQNDDVADILALRGHLYLSQGLHENALLDFQKMLVTIVPGTSADYRTMPGLQYENPYFKNIITAYFRKGDAFFGWFNRSKNPEHLVQALANYRAAYRHIVIARQSIDDEASKPHILSFFSESVNNSIACAHTLYNKTKDQKYIDDMLYFVELTKYLNVLDALQRAERANHSEIPVNLLFDLENTRSELNELQQLEWRQEHLSLSRDSVANLRDHILKLIDRRRELSSKISKYTGHQQVDTTYISTLGKIQNHLGEEEQIVEFFWGRDSIYTLSITDRSASVFVTPGDASLDSLLLSTHAILEGRRSYKADHIQAYGRMTSTIYHRLFEPLPVRKKLIVIPDGPLNLIPVEALVVDYRPSGLSFKALDYFIYHQEILYAYSASILYYKPVPDLGAIESVLAFSYSGDGKATFDRSTQGPLPGTYKEGQSLTRIFKHVTNFTGQDALKSNFVKQAQHYDLIHLGIHGLGSPDLADNARLIFRGDSLESGDLYAYDIYNLKMDARLVVLSACETGVGKRQTGEGIFSIARAFSYAGCPSVVMSMWRAPDEFTATMMDRFYEKLHDGNSISVSLRESKLQFLDESDELLAHPANWATFVLNGRDQSFKKQTPTALWIVLASMGVVLLVFGLRRIRASRRTEN